MKERGKFGQVTIFIIIAIVIVVGILIFLLFKDKIIPSSPGASAEENPSEFLRICLEDDVREKVEIMMHQGGTLNPVFNKTFKFESEGNYKSFAYLCYNQNNYLPCINQKPLLISNIKTELKNNLKTEVKDCSNSLITSLEKAGYDVSQNGNDFDVELTDKGVLIKFNKEISLTKGEQNRKINNLQIIIPTKIYTVTKVAQEIVSQEAKYCYFEYIGYSYLYPNFIIEKYKTDNSDIIYTIMHRQSHEWIRFAIRGCVLPAGL